MKPVVLSPSKRYASATQPLPLAWRYLLALTGLFLLADSAYLVSVKVTHAGVLVPALLGLWCLVYARWARGCVAWVAAARWRRVLWRMAQWGLLLWAISLALFFGYLSHTNAQAQAKATDAQAQVQTQQLPPPQWLVVLGSSAFNGVPSPTLAQRLDTTLEIAQRQPQARIVVSGGIDHGQTISEGRAMADYLIAHGIAPERLVVEERSTSTYENLQFSEQLLTPLGFTKDTPVTLITSDFHTLRAAHIARKAGWTQVQTAAAPTPLYLRYNAWLREYFAFGSGFVLREY